MSRPVRSSAAGRLLACAVVLLAMGRELPAQVWGGRAEGRDTSRLRPELRVDYLGASTQAVHVGAGLSVPAGIYARFGVAAGAGPVWDDGRTFTSARVDLTGRFMIDPFRRSRWGVSIGGGVGVRHDDDHTRAVALLLADVEGPGRRGWIPFGAIGLGGGVRVTAGVRRATTAGR